MREREDRSRGWEGSRGKRSTRYGATPIASPVVQSAFRTGVASLRSSGFPSGTSSCTSSRAPQLSREINELATYRQPRPGLVLVNRSRKATVTAENCWDKELESISIVKRDSQSCHLSLQLRLKEAKKKRERERRRTRERESESREVLERGHEIERKIEDLYRSLTFRTVHVSDPVSQLFLRQRFVYVPEVSNGYLW